MSSGVTCNPAADLARLETEAKVNARQHVAKLLQRPDQLEKVEQIRKRVFRKKGAVESMLKTSVQSQLDGVRTGLNQLSNALKDLKGIKDSLTEVDTTYTSIAGLGDKLKKVREENSRHSQLGAAVENLKHIFNVPETVKKCEDLINDGKLLHAHKCLTDLESSRNDLLQELHKQTTQSPTDKNTVNHYFADVERLAENLGKQLWLILHRMTITVRREPPIIVTVMRIIEREERTDTFMLKRYDRTGFIPPGRPRRWKQKAFKALDEAVVGRIEGCQMEDRTVTKMWLVRHLEVIRQLAIEDLRVVKTLCEPCFPPHYEVYNQYVQMYHTAIEQHSVLVVLQLKELVEQGLEGNEIIALLTWIEEYFSTDMLGHPDLKINIIDVSPLLGPQIISELQNRYLQTTRKNFQDWMGNAIKTDVKDWMRAQEPDADEKGYFNTSLPVILFQMIEQNLAVASTINNELVMHVMSVCVDELSFFVKTYRAELANYKEKHFQARSETQYFLHYMIANINNCYIFVELMLQLSDKYGQDPSLPKIDNHRLKSVGEEFHNLASEICDWLVEEVFLDLQILVNELLTREWLTNAHAVDTICVTLEDYCQDFVHLRDDFYEALMKKIQARLGHEYLKALFSKKISFKSYDERFPAAEKISQEAEQLQQLFTQLIPQHQDDSPFEALPMLAEVIKLKDTSMMSLELSGLASRYPDIHTDQLVSLLMIREDLGRSGSRQLVIDSLGEDHDAKAKSVKTIFSSIG